MPTNTYVALDKVTLATATSTITFSSIPAGYTDLILVMNAKAVTGTPSIAMRFNGDNTTNYSWTALVGNGTAASSSKASSTVNNWVSALLNGVSPTNFNSGTIQIINYSNTTTHKTALTRWYGVDYEIDAICNLWRSTAAINQVSLIAQSNLAIGSTFELYGILAEGVSPTTKATGGAVYSDSTYYYHVFGASGTFTPTQSITADYLVVAGGGGGGALDGGGGGGGGLRSTIGSTGGGGSLESALSLTAQAYTVTVGAGGTGALGAGNGGTNGTNGSNSVFSTITSTGGGFGGSNAAGFGGTSSVGAPGGSGGGAGPRNVASGAGTTNQGYAGGIATGTFDGGGGGGGAGAVGSNGVNAVAGAGGIGVSINSIVTATGTGKDNYYAGGGGGGSLNTGSGAVGGTGGGGAGTNTNTVGGAGVSNTGGGGGGSGFTGSATANGGAGGSGLVIIRYAK